MRTAYTVLGPQDGAPKMGRPEVERTPLERARDELRQIDRDLADALDGRLSGSRLEHRLRTIRHRITSARETLWLVTEAPPPKASKAYTPRKRSAKPAAAPSPSP